MVIVCKHIGEELFFQILNKFGDSWGFLADRNEVECSDGGRLRVAACQMS